MAERTGDTMADILTQYDRLDRGKPGVARIARGNEEAAARIARYNGIYLQLKQIVHTGDVGALIKTLTQAGLTEEDREAILKVRDSRTGATLLHWVAAYGRYDMVDPLVDMGAPLYLTNRQKMTPSEFGKALMVTTFGSSRDSIPMQYTETYERLKKREGLSPRT